MQFAATLSWAHYIKEPVGLRLYNSQARHFNLNQDVRITQGEVMYITWPARLCMLLCFFQHCSTDTYSANGFYIQNYKREMFLLLVAIQT